MKHRDFMDRERLSWIIKNYHRLDRPRKEIIKEMKTHGLYHPRYSSNRVNLDDLIMKASLKMSQAHTE